MQPPRQMVLKMETNLGARSRLEDMDDDTQVSSFSKVNFDVNGTVQSIRSIVNVGRSVLYFILMHDQNDQNA